MQTPSLTSLLLVFGFCLDQRWPDCVKFEGDRSSPSNVSPEVRNKLEKAPSSFNASHAVTLSSPAYGNWALMLQINDVYIPGIPDSTPGAMWHSPLRTSLARVNGPRAPENGRSAPISLITISVQRVFSACNFDNSNCVPALVEWCTNTLSDVGLTGSCDLSNGLESLMNDEVCVSRLSGGLVQDHYVQSHAYCMSSPRVCCVSEVLTEFPPLPQHSMPAT